MHDVRCFSVSLLTASNCHVQAYMSVAPYIATFELYRQPLAQHLLTVKLRHWEISMRDLAAKALAALASTDSEYFGTGALDYLLPRCLDPVLDVSYRSSSLPCLSLVCMQQSSHDPPPAHSEAPALRGWVDTRVTARACSRCAFSDSDRLGK